VHLDYIFKNFSILAASVFGKRGFSSGPPSTVRITIGLTCPDSSRETFSKSFKLTIRSKSVA